MAFNYSLTFNQLNTIEHPSVILCNRYQRKYGEIYPVDDLRITLNFNAPREISFSTPKFYNGKRNTMWNRIKDLRCVFIEKFGYFEIYVSQKNDAGEIKNITGKSIEVELGQIYLHDFQVNDIDDDSYEEYTEIIKFYNPLEPSLSLLHKIIEKAPAWQIGHVDEVLWNKQRQFSIDNESIYDFLTGEVSEQFECVFIFDSFNRIINAYKLDDYGDKTSIFISRENFANDITLEADAGQIKNCFKVIGGDGIDIREVNPNGTDYIWALSNLNKEDMSSGLISRLDEYNNAYDAKRIEYENVISEMHDSLTVLGELYERYPLSTDESNDLTKCGLTELKRRLLAKQNVEDVYKTSGYGDPDNSMYESIYLPNHLQIEEIEDEIKVREKEIDDATVVYEAAIRKRDIIQDYLDLEKWLGKELWLELSLYRREDIYENSTYEEESNTTQLERFQMERDLLEEANQKLQDITNPLYKANVSLSNILANRELAKHDIGDFSIGNFIQLGIDEDHVVKLRVVSISINFKSLEEISVEFSEMRKINGAMSDAQSIFDRATTAATSYVTVMKQYDKNKNNMTFIQNVRKDGLEAALVNITNSEHQEITLTERGLMGKQWNPEKVAYEDEQLQIINNCLVMTDDNWRSCRLALGKIFYNGTYSYGLIADTLIGNIVVSEKLHVENENGSFIVNENGAKLTNLDLTVTNGQNTLVIDPKNGSQLFKIYKNSDPGNPQLYFDSNGNAYFTGGINVNDQFKVNSDGNVWANDGTYRGTVYATSGEIGGFYIDSNRLYGDGNINIYNGNITISGASNYFKNEGYFNFDGTWANGLVEVTNGTILIKGPNAYVRAWSTSSGGGYHKLIGISSGGNIIIGDPPGSSGYYYSEDPNSMGSLSKLPVLIYGTSLKFNDENVAMSSDVPSRSLSGLGFTPVSAAYGTCYAISGASSDFASAAYVRTCHDTRGSDIRLKEDVFQLNEALINKYMDIRPVQYKYKNGLYEHTGKYKLGFIANEVNCLFDENIYDIVRKNYITPADKEKQYVDSYFLGLDYNNFHALHVLINQKHEREIQQLKNDNLVLQNKLTKIQNKLQGD